MTYTQDSISDRITITQSRSGYRFGMDALLLATDLPPLPDAPLIIDLGAGQGAVALCVASRCPQVRVLAIERQQSLLTTLRKNIEDNALTHVEAIDADLRLAREQLPAHIADLVLSNPPYFKTSDSRHDGDPERAAARHELNGGLDDFIRAAFHLLKPRGWLKLIIPPDRLGDLYAAIGAHGDLSLVSLRCFHDRVDRDAYLIEALLRRGKRYRLTIRQPLIIHTPEGAYTEESDARIRGAAIPGAAV